MAGGSTVTNGSKKDFLNKTHGFTLTELLVAMAIFGILASAAIMIFRHSQTTSTLSRLRTTALRDARRALEGIQSEIVRAEAGSVNVDSSGQLSFAVKTGSGLRNILYIHEDTQLNKVVQNPDGTEQSYNISDHVENF